MEDCADIKQIGRRHQQSSIAADLHAAGDKKEQQSRCCQHHPDLEMHDLVGHGTGATSAVVPMIARTLKILEPMTLPTATALWPRRAAMRVAANSGSEVPKAITVNPIVAFDTPQEAASDEAPSITRWAPSGRAD